mmetsp:Transcript_26544/g.32176  ORF Transcript_26544/g.32176 Transcript_26544/m.32176 type:complete len:245 (+) Transcript_26544:296-1030(+)
MFVTASMSLLTSVTVVARDAPSSSILLSTIDPSVTLQYTRVSKFPNAPTNCSFVSASASARLFSRSSSSSARLIAFAFAFSSNLAIISACFSLSAFTLASSSFRACSAAALFSSISFLRASAALACLSPSAFMASSCCFCILSSAARRPSFLAASLALALEAPKRRPTPAPLLLEGALGAGATGLPAAEVDDDVDVGFGGSPLSSFSVRFINSNASSGVNELPFISSSPRRVVGGAVNRASLFA